MVSRVKNRTNRPESDGAFKLSQGSQGSQTRSICIVGIMDIRIYKLLYSLVHKSSTIDCEKGQRTLSNFPQSKALVVPSEICTTVGNEAGIAATPRRKF